MEKNSDLPLGDFLSVQLLIHGTRQLEKSRQHIAQLEKFAEYCQDYISHLLLLLTEGCLWYVHYNF